MNNILSILPILFFFILILPIFNFHWKGSINILHSFNIYYHYLILFYFHLSNLLLRFWDRGLIELFSPYGLVNFLNYFSFRLEL